MTAEDLVNKEDIQTLDDLMKTYGDEQPGARRTSCAWLDRQLRLIGQMAEVGGQVWALLRKYGLGMAIGAVVGLMVGLLIGGLAWRLAAVLLTSLVGLLLAGVGLAALLQQHNPDLLKQTRSQSWTTLLIGVGGLWLMGALLQGLILKSPDGGAYNMLTDETAADYPKREKRFDIVYHLYSFERNNRLRLRVQVSAEEKVPSVTGVWPTANWLEREIYDMFGVVYEGHPDLKRILMPDEWVGHPLRKDYDILKQDADWVKSNLGIESGQ